ncbi:uncharacterized protein UV8b_07825 [Ustilaginoidea virens]|uniref:MYB DNA-binding domain protein n=1 Tax=Ustilaginoidea virens TaxID=1159556 RepID=A0A8E5HXQ7_USTVR|nr:uncharacterized protein UV8b_07825 [Ustilaginoidea virens]QUC23584.1 hypothetical protein UV8b_07825 [Ustilaginoidea virens]
MCLGASYSPQSPQNPQNPQRSTAVHTPSGYWVSASTALSRPRLANVNYLALPISQDAGILYYANPWLLLSTTPDPDPGTTFQGPLQQSTSLAADLSEGLIDSVACEHHAIMQQWQVGPVPEYVYSNSTHPPNDMHNHPYQPDMARRNEQRMEFPYAAAQPNMAPQQQQQHHPAPGQPPISVSQAPGASGAQQQAQTPTPAQQGRQRKRPAPNTAPSPATAAAPAAPVPASQVQPPAPTPPTPQAAPAPPPAQAQAQAQAASEDANTTPVQPPPAKKSRTNTPWTPQEELRLKQMRDAGNSWAEIAKTFPARTEGSVKKHWYKDMHYAEFAEDESQALLNAIKEYENNKWKVIGQKVGKPAKACEQYAKEHFPDLFTAGKGR